MNKENLNNNRVISNDSAADENFDAKKMTKEVVFWIRDFFKKNGRDSKAVVAISGGKDSSVVAALCTEALGKDRVFGVLMPRGEQPDIDYSKMLVDFLGIDYAVINIGKPCDELEKAIKMGLGEDYKLSKQTITNLPARLRMTTVYGVSQSINGRVANTCNLSEDWVGYSTRYGDAAGDFSPLANFTVEEVKAIGRELNLPRELVDKTPIDGLSGKSDEENLGFTYKELDTYIRTGICKDKVLKDKIDKKRRDNKFKLELMPSFQSNIKILAEDE